MIPQLAFLKIVRMVWWELLLLVGTISFLLCILILECLCIPFLTLLFFVLFVFPFLFLTIIAHWGKPAITNPCALVYFLAYGIINFQLLNSCPTLPIGKWSNSFTDNVVNPSWARWRIYRKRRVSVVFGLISVGLQYWHFFPSYRAFH